MRNFSLPTESFNLAALLLLFGSTLLGSSLANAQSIDSMPPVIELEQLVDGVADLSQVFTVQIAEDGILQDATLYYRRAGQQPYTPVTMEPLGNTGYFSVTITTDPSDLRAIEYYVQARDAAGNRTVSGYAFDPYVRNLIAADRLIQEVTQEPVVQSPTTNTPPLLQQRWFQITLGVVAVGLATTLISDDDGGTDTVVAPVTFEIP
ncbi:MAG: hypothetical protein AB8B63_22265 [Granulosicoccus sp.]